MFETRWLRYIGKVCNPESVVCFSKEVYDLDTKSSLSLNVERVCWYLALGHDNTIRNLLAGE